jgi:hypothetical protein
MRRWATTLWVTVALGLFSQAALAQEIRIHSGFIFYSGKYSVDEETFGLYAEGHKLSELLKESPKALEAFQYFEGWHMTANVMTGLALGAIVLGGVFYIPGVDKSIDAQTAAIASFAAGGGLLIFGLISEFVSWGRLSTAAELFNKSVDVDDGPAMRWIPAPSLGFSEHGGQLGLTWSF